MKQQIENIIKENLPENMETCTCEEDIGYHTKECDFAPFGFNYCLSQINTSLIADEVLKVVVEKIEELELSCVDDSLLGRTDEYLIGYNTSTTRWRIKRDELLSTLSPNNENKNTK